MSIYLYLSLYLVGLKFLPYTLQIGGSEKRSAVYSPLALDAWFENKILQEKSPSSSSSNRGSSQGNTYHTRDVTVVYKQLCHICGANRSQVVVLQVDMLHSDILLFSDAENQNYFCSLNVYRSWNKNLEHSNGFPKWNSKVNVIYCNQSPWPNG